MDALAKSERVVGGQLHRVLRNSTFYLLGNIASRILGFIAIPFYSHFLTPAQYGTVELIELSTQVVAIAFGLQSIGTALTRLFHDQDTPEQEANIVSTSVLGTALLSAVIAVGAVLAAGPISLAVFHSTAQAPLLQAAFVAMWFANMVEVVLVYERIRERAQFFFVYSMVSLVGSLALNIYFIGFAGAGIWGFVFSKLIVTGLGSVYLLWRIMREVGWHWRQEYIPPLIRFGLPLCLASVSAFAIHFSDRFFLADAVSLAELGRYALAYRFAFLVSILVGESFGKSWNVTFYRFVGMEGWKDRFARVAAYLMFALFLAALAIALMAPELFSFMVPPSFYPPYLLLPILVFSYVFRECGDFFRNLLLINKRSGTVGNVVLGGAVLNGLLNFAMIPAFGIYGAAAATMGTWLAYMAVFWVLAWREHAVPFRVFTFLKITLLAIGIFALGDWLRVESRLLQIVVDCLWVGLFTLLCLIFYFSPAERSELLSAAEAQAMRLFGAPSRPIGDWPSGLPLVLMLAFYFPPENTIGAARPGRFSKYLSRLGYPVSVVSHWIEGAAGSTAIRVPAPRRRGQRFFSANGLLRLVARRFLPYDDRLPWMPPAFKAASAVLADNPDHIVVSSHPPLATHLVALALKFRHASRWVADFRDPLAGNPMRPARRAIVLDAIVERMVFRHADAVIANTDAVKQIWLKRYPQWKHKIHLIWNGFDREDAVDPKPISQRTRRTMAHIGTIYGGRTPEPLIASLDRLVAAGTVAAESIQLRLIGPIQNHSLDPSADICQRLQARGCLHVDNRMAPQHEAREEMLDADYLVLLDIVDNEVPGIQLPAKIFDYIRACRPILAFTPADSVITRVLSAAGIPNACISPTASGAEVDAAVEAFLARPITEIRPSETFWHDFDSASQTYILANILTRISAQPAHATEPVAQAEQA